MPEHRKRSSKKGRQQDHNNVRGKYNAQRVRTEANKVKAWTRHLAEHPGDLQAKQNIGRLYA